MKLPWAGSADIHLGVLDPSIPLLGWPHVFLDRHEQAFHAMIWRITGQGKSVLLQQVFLQHFFKGGGVGIIEPHHDLSCQTLSYLVGRGYFRDPKAFERLVYIDWGNGAFVPFNVLRSRHASPHDVALNVLEAMLRVWPELAQAPFFKMLSCPPCWSASIIGCPSPPPTRSSRMGPIATNSWKASPTS